MTTQSDVMIVGAGLAGLCCAIHLKRSGIDAVIIEASDRVGGRVQTDCQEGFRLDRGFQVLLTSYPEARRVLDYDDLELRAFHPGAMVRYQRAFHRVTDPWRQPLEAVRSAFSPIGTLADKLRVARLRRLVNRDDCEQLFDSPKLSSDAFLQSCGFSASMIDRFFRPFFGGVFLESELSTSSRMLQFVFRMFATGDAAIPARGMGSIADQLARRLAPDQLRLRSAVAEIDGTTVTLQSNEQFRCRAVVVATQQPAAARLIPGMRSFGSRSVSCLYFATPQPPIEEPILVLNANREGPVNNLCVPSNVAPTYAPPGGALISASVLGTDGLDDMELEYAVRSQMRHWFGSTVSQWQHLRTYRIPDALPVVDPRWGARGDQHARLRPGVYICGDHCENPSIQGAMASGRRAAERILADRGGTDLEARPLVTRTQPAIIPTCSGQH